MQPIVQALLVADHVYVDKQSGKKIVAGIFRNLYFKNPEKLKAELEEHGIKGIPGGLEAGSPYAYLSLTGIHKEESFTLRYVDVGEDRAFFQSCFSIDCSDPLQVLEVILPLPKLPTPKAGVYALELLWNDEPIGVFRITVDEFNIKGPTNDTDRSD